MMDGMDDLVTWLRAQLDEDERVAKAAAEVGECGCHPGAPADRWAYHGDAEIDVDNGCGHILLAGASYGGTFLEHDLGTHIARHDPARVLREVEAKRRLLTQFELRGNSVRATVKPPTGGVWDDLLRLLALPYFDRPGYRAEWRP